MAVARSRKWLITINNPLEHGFDHARIKAAVLDLPGIVYWCLCDEQGAECETLHTHVFFVCENQLSHTQVDARFPTFHRDIARGKSSENRAYVLKDGEKFNKQSDGSYSYKDTWRELEVTYIFGKTGSGKTRSVMDKYGYSNCYRVTDYKHPFDTYDGQDVIIFEEFRGGLKHGDMLNYLDGYPLLLPCRYFNRQACYTKVFIITNVPPDAQYTSVDMETRKAFFRRIHTVREYDDYGHVSDYAGVDAYLRRHDWAEYSGVTIRL